MVVPAENEFDTGGGVSDAELRKAVAADISITSPVGAQQDAEVQAGKACGPGSGSASMNRKTCSGRTSVEWWRRSRQIGCDTHC